MVTIVKIKNDNTFKYKNINGRIEYTETDIYIYIGIKLFRCYLKNIIKLRYKKLTFKFNLAKKIIKVYENKTECSHNWSNGICTKCKSIWTSIYSDGDWMTSDMATFIDRNMNTQTHKIRLFGKLLILEPVETIGENAFWNCSNLTSITIGNSVTSIGKGAFSYCTKLETITIPNSVTSIGIGAFCDCDNLETIIIGNSVTKIDEYAFCDCDNLESITIGNSVKTIGGNVFSSCDKLESIIIPDLVTKIGGNAFNNCSKLETIIIGNSVTEIGDNAFYGCTGLTSIKVNSGNQKYTDIDGVLVDKDQAKLIQYPIGKKTSTYTIPDSVTEIGDNAFCECTNLKTITIPNSVTEIGVDAFYYCSNLETIIIGYLPTITFGENAFVDMSPNCKMIIISDTALTELQKNTYEQKIKSVKYIGTFEWQTSE